MRLSGKMKQRGLTPLFHFLEKIKRKNATEREKNGKTM